MSRPVTTQWSRPFLQSGSDQETSSVAYNRRDLIQGMSYTGDGRAESQTSWVVYPDITDCRKELYYPLAKQIKGRDRIPGAPGLGSSDGIYVMVTQNLRSCMQRKLLKATFLRRHLQSALNHTDNQKEWDRVSFLKKGCGYLSEVEKDAWQKKQYMFTAFLPLVTQYTYAPFSYTIPKCSHLI